MKSKNKVEVKKIVKKVLEAKLSSNVAGLIPLGDRVLIKPVDVLMETQTASGIIIPDTVSKEKPEQGEVIGVGKKVSSEIKIGDKVVFSRYGYEDVKVKDVEYYILKEENILAVIK